MSSAVLDRPGLVPAPTSFVETLTRRENAPPKPLGVVPTYLSEPADLEVLLDLLRSIARTAPDLEVLLVDDRSPAQALVDEIPADIDGLKLEVCRRPLNEGFARTVNVGLQRALKEGRDAVLINADVEFIEPGWLDRMLAQPRQDDTGPAEVVGGLLLYPTGLIQHAGIFFSLLHRAFDHRFKYGPGDLPEAQDAYRCPVTGALQLIRHKTLIEVGLYDEGFRLGWEDVDYCIRVFQAGGECVYQPTVRAYHYESMFRGRPSPKVADWQRRSWIYFTEKYKRTSFAEWVPSLL